MAGLIDVPKQIALITGHNSDIAQPLLLLGGSSQGCFICLFIELPSPTQPAANLAQV
ncbi:MAG: hypothetical protein ACRCYF_00085 [Shewanella sp.]